MTVIQHDRHWGLRVTSKWAAALAGLLLCVTARAAITATGEVIPFPIMPNTTIQIANQGVGTVVIDGGSSLTSSFLQVAQGANGVGTAIVRDPGSLWRFTGGEIGNNGIGRLEVRNGATVEVPSPANLLRLANNQSANGTIIVDGPGSVLQVIAPFTVSQLGSGALRLSNGAIVNVPEDATTIGINGRIELAGALMRTNQLQNSGTIIGSGELAVLSSGTLNNQGRIEAGAGGRLLLSGASGGSLMNNGSIVAERGEIEIRRIVNNLANTPNAGRITLQDGTIRFPFPTTTQPGLQNSSLMSALGGENHIYGRILNLDAGDIAITNQSTTFFHHDVTSQGTITVRAGSTAIFLEDLLMSGTGTLLADLGGAQGFGKAEVYGTLQLAGALAVSLAGGFVPAPGDQFTVLTSGGRTGTFDAVTTTPGAPVQFHAIYTPTDATIFVARPGDKTWGLDANGNASVSTNWLGGVAPGAIDDKVAFTTIISANRTVAADAPFTAGSLYFDDDNRYFLQGPAAITLDVSTGNARIDVKTLHGTAAHTIAAPLLLSDNTTIDVAAGGSLSITSPMTAARGVALTKDGPGTLAVRNIRAAGLTISGGTVQVLPGGGHDGTSVVDSLTIDPAARLDLTNNAFVLDYSGPASPLAEVRSQIASGFAAGAWTGNGITSSTASSDPTRALGYGESSEILGPTGGTFAGQAVDATAVLVRFTVKGDANLDGVVGFPDLVALAQNYNGTDKLWTQGDFNHDGAVGFPDLVALAQNYNSALPTSPIPGATAAFHQDLAAAMAQVPEPTLTPALTLLASLSARRPRRTGHPPLRNRSAT